MVKSDNLSVTVYYVLHFEDEEHQKYHDLLVSFGFVFSVKLFTICLKYYHPIKNIEVELISTNEPGEKYEPLICLIKEADGIIKRYFPILPVSSNSSIDYSEAETEWITEAKTGLESFERELYIQIIIRPNSMNSFKVDLKKLESRQVN